MTARQSQKTEVALIGKDIEFIKNKLISIETSMGGMSKNVSDGYVTKIEFEPIKKLVYGVVGLILLTFMGALVTYFINVPK